QKEKNPLQESTWQTLAALLTSACCAGRAQMQPGWGFVSDTRVNCCKEKLGEHPAGLLLPLLLGITFVPFIVLNCLFTNCVQI
uniref:Uncharacterized protein n=1 Tax=Anser brachyrhynchus TaxID=132585 RepID=A0A8B9C742_9AVES